jgi:hypothetical protein
MKEEGMFYANMDRIPILEADGIILGQSKAIERFIFADVTVF